MVVLLVGKIWLERASHNRNSQNESILNLDLLLAKRTKSAVTKKNGAKLGLCMNDIELSASSTLARESA